MKSLHIKELLANLKWVSEFDLRMTYWTLVRSSLDYASIIYGAAQKIYSKLIELIHHLDLRLIMGAFKTSLIHNLYSEAIEPPLKARTSTQIAI